MFCFLIQSTWCAPGNLRFVFSLIMHTDARGYSCIGRHLKEAVLWGTIMWSKMGTKHSGYKGLFILHVQESHDKEIFNLHVYMCLFIPHCTVRLNIEPTVSLCEFAIFAKHEVSHSPMIIIQSGWRCIFLPLYLISKVLLNCWDELKAKPSIIKWYVRD